MHAPGFSQAIISPKEMRWQWQYLGSLGSAIASACCIDQGRGGQDRAGGGQAGTGLGLHHAAQRAPQLAPSSRIPVPPVTPPILLAHPLFATPTPPDTAPQA